MIGLQFEPSLTNSDKIFQIIIRHRIYEYEYLVRMVLQSLSQNDCHETPTGSFEEVSGVCPHSTNVKCRGNNIY